MGDPLISRRGFLGSILAAGGAPVIAKFPVMRVRPVSGLLVPEDPWTFLECAGGREIRSSLYRVMSINLACSVDGPMTMTVDMVKIDQDGTYHEFRTIERESWESIRKNFGKTRGRQVAMTVGDLDVASARLNPGDTVSFPSLDFFNDEPNVSWRET